MYWKLSFIPVRKRRKESHKYIEKILEIFTWIATLIAGAIPCSHSYLSKTEW